MDETECWKKCLSTLNCQLVAYQPSGDLLGKCCLKASGDYDITQSSGWKMLADRPFHSFQHSPNSHPGKRGAGCETGIPCDEWKLVLGVADADACKTLCLLHPDCNVAISHNTDGRCYLDHVENWMDGGYGPFDSWIK